MRSLPFSSRCATRPPPARSASSDPVGHQRGVDSRCARYPTARVVKWIDAQPLETLFLSAITVAELRAGVALLPAGKRRAGLHESLETRVLPLFSGRVLPFDLGCTQAYAELMAKARASGLAITSADGYIAAIAAANGLAVATRDTDPFEAAGATVINPWKV